MPSRPDALGRVCVGALASVLCLAACASPPALTPTPTARPTPSPQVDVVFANVTGAWRRTPVQVGADLVDPSTSACRNALASASAGAEDLETVLVDARGERFLTLVLTGTTKAAVCRVRLADKVPTVLGTSAIDVLETSLDDTEITVAHFALLEDRDAGDPSRTLIVGQIGQRPKKATAGFDNETFVFAAKSSGWYALWWPGRERAATIAAQDAANLVIGSVDQPTKPD